MIYLYQDKKRLKDIFFLPLLLWQVRQSKMFRRVLIILISLFITIWKN